MTPDLKQTPHPDVEYSRWVKLASRGEGDPAAGRASVTVVFTLLGNGSRSVILTRSGPAQASFGSNGITEKRSQETEFDVRNNPHRLQRPAAKWTNYRRAFHNTQRSW
jgi:hypothetical protein